MSSKKTKSQKKEEALAVVSTKNAKQMDRAIQAAVDQRVSKVRAKLNTELVSSAKMGKVHVDAKDLYLLAIINPEAAANACVPDDYPDDTVRYGSVTLANVGAVGGSGLTFDANGQFKTIITPDLRKHFYFSDAMLRGTFAAADTITSPNPLSPGYSLGAWVSLGSELVRMDNDYPKFRPGAYSTSRILKTFVVATDVALPAVESAVFPVEMGRQSSVASINNPLTVTDSVILNIASQNGVVPPGIPFFGVGTAGNNASCGTVFKLSFGITVPYTSNVGFVHLAEIDPRIIFFGFDASGNAGQVLSPIMGPVPPAGNLDWNDMTISGSYLNGVAANGWTGNFNLTRITGYSIAFTGLSSNLLLGAEITRANMTIYNRVTGLTGIDLTLLSNYTNTTGYTIQPQGVNVTFTPTPIASGQILSARAVPEYLQYNGGLCSAYRAVGISSWGEYTGSDLNNSGQILNLLNDSRRAPAGLNYDFTTASGLASVTRSYDGLLKHGNYAIWKPKAEADTDWSAFNEQWTFDKPYIDTMYTNTIAAGQSLRIRVAARWELISLSNLLNKQPSRVDNEELEFTFRVLQAFPDCVENDFHLSSIGNFFKNALGMAKKVAPVLAPALSAVATGMGQPGVGKGITALGNIVSHL